MESLCLSGTVEVVPVIDRWFSFTEMNIPYAAEDVVTAVKKSTVCKVIEKYVKRTARFSRTLPVLPAILLKFNGSLCRPMSGVGSLSRISAGSSLAIGSPRTT